MNNEYFKKVFGDWWNYIDYKELENELNAYKNNRSEEECTLGYEAYSVCDHGDITD